MVYAVLEWWLEDNGDSCLYLHPTRQLNDQQHFRISFEISTCIFMYVNKFGGSCPQSAKVRSAQLGENHQKTFTLKLEDGDIYRRIKSG